MLFLSFLREGIDFAPLPGDDLREDMRGRAKAVKSDAPAVACHSQRAPADQACAKQGGRLHIGKTRRQRKAEMRVRNDMGQIGRAHVCPVTNAQLVCRLLLVKKKKNT